MTTSLKSASENQISELYSIIKDMEEKDPDFKFTDAFETIKSDGERFYDLVMEECNGLKRMFDRYSSMRTKPTKILKNICLNCFIVSCLIKIDVKIIYLGLHNSEYFIANASNIALITSYYKNLITENIIFETSFFDTLKVDKKLINMIVDNPKPLSEVLSSYGISEIIFSDKVIEYLAKIILKMIM
jgi:hypothetical protein